MMQNHAANMGGEEKSLMSAKYFDSRIRQQIAGRSSIEASASIPMNLSYVDAVNIYAYQSIEYAHRTSDKYGFYHEDIWNHYDVNHSYRQAPSVAGWVNMNKFDAFDNKYSGVYTLNGSTYRARTGRFALTSNENTLLLGYAEPFDEVNFTISNAPGATVTWSYWNGSAWAPISPRSDTTNGVRMSGQLRFTPPADWKKLVLVQGQYRKWWLRATFSGAGTYPAVETVTTWDLIVGKNGYGNPVYPGWCASSATRINTDLTGEGRDLAYDPTPPAQCGARFRWQGRMLGIWAKNLQNCNTTNIQNGQYTCARMISEVTRATMIGDGRNGGYLDDLFPPNTRDLAEPRTANSCVAGTDCPSAGLCGANQACQRNAVGELFSHTETGYRGDYYEQLATHYRKYIDYIREQRPDAKSSANTGDNRTRYAGDGWVYETGISTMGVPDAVKNLDVHSRDSGNTNCAHMLAFISDTQSEIVAPDGWFYFDRGQRGPMLALGIFYTYANECIDMFYNVSSPSWYAGNDDYQYWNEAPDGATSAQVAADESTNLKTIYGNFAAFPSTANTLIRIGTTGETLRITKVNDTMATTTERIYNAAPAGAPLWLIRTGYLSQSTPPPSERIFRWNAFFPAMEVDLGEPDTVNGIAGDILGVPKPKGFRFNNWISAVDSETKNGITRRDFTKAIIVHARANYADNSGGSYGPNHGPLKKSMATTYSKPFSISQNGKALTLYPLRVDGYTDNSLCNYGPGTDYRTPDGGCSQFRVKTGEAMILMKQPVKR